MTSNPNGEKKDDDTLSDDDYALMILKNRLATGEISPEEFNKLSSTLSASYGLTELKTEIENLRDKIERTEESLSEEHERGIRKGRAIGGVILLAIGLMMVIGGGATVISSFCIGQPYGSCENSGLNFIVGAIVFWIGMIPTIFGVRYIASA